ncbi:bifunctional NAD(P)H-dependent oxidoreductase/GNAT family N-acetyltransferase [Yinghuangia aomiensis]|uniref:bifunctional NAD(P)H-dependent oxidoreductase/GNAT family N-acetyltransferase n=1 Tax=Yinghuangia aomiensis TaxID=676205 RepID=UPI0031E814C5
MSTKPVRILVLICSNRPGALGPAVGEWVVETITPRATELAVELVPTALGDLDLPFLDEEQHPASGIYRHAHTRRWSAIVDAADGFIVVTPEYNYGMPATLKNALDYLSREWAWKPIGFVSYGNTSAGTRSVQHAKQVVTTLRLVPLGAAVAIRIGEATDNGRIRPNPALERAAVGVLDELVRVAQALRPMRERAGSGVVPGPLPGSYVRRLTPDDAPEVTVLQRCCWVDEAFANDTLDVPALHESPEQVRDWLAAWYTLGLWLDGRLLGMVRARRLETDWHIGRLGVVPDLRGQRVGQWLLRAAEAAAEPGCRRMVLFTGAASGYNIGLYQSEGYERASTADTDGVVGLVKELNPAESTPGGGP